LVTAARRGTTTDSPGYLLKRAQAALHAALAGALRDHGATLHIVTHEARAGAVEAALNKIAELPETQSPPSALPVISSRGVTGRSCRGSSRRSAAL